MADANLTAIAGRAAEERALRDCLAALMEGRGGLVTVTGAAGIGKTTMVELLAGKARQAGALVLAGHCYDLTATPPYGPWVDLLSAYQPAAGLPPVPASLIDGGQLRPVGDRDALFEQVRRFFDEVAASRPLVVILEDLHWSDTASLDLLGNLAGSGGGRPLLLAITWRDDLDGDNPLSDLAGIVPDGRLTRIDLQRLSRAAIGELIAAALPLPAAERERLADHLDSRVDGNPFFIHEMLRALLDSGTLRAGDGGWTLGDLDAVLVPPLVQEALERRLSRLDEDALRLLELAAIVGAEVTLDLWRAVSDADDPALTDALSQADHLRLIQHSATEPRLRFNHGLIRQALYRRQGLRRRQAGHRRVAEALLERPESPPDALAYHFQQADDPRAIDWLVRAGERARAVYAPNEAIVALTAAIELADRFGVPASVMAWRERGLAHEMQGQLDQARHDQQQALALARARHDRHAEWQALIDLGMLWTERDYTLAIDYFQHALALAETIDDPAPRAHTLNRIGNWHVNQDEPLPAIEHHRSALEIFEAAADQRGQAETLDLLALASYLAGDLIASAAHYRRAVDLMRALDDRQGLVSSLVTLSQLGGTYEDATLVTAEGTPDEWLGYAEQGLAIARASGLRSGEAYALALLSCAARAYGRFRIALEYGRQALTLATEIEHLQWSIAAHAGLAQIHLSLLDPAGALAHGGQALTLARRSGSRYWTRLVSGDLALIRLALGQPAEAEALLTEVLSSTTPMETAAVRYCWLSRVELDLALGRPADALETIDALIASALHVTPERPIPRLALHRGQSLIELGRIDEAEIELALARAGAERCGFRPLLWRVDRLLAELHATAGRRKEATASRAAARATIDELAGEVADVDLRDQFLRQALPASDTTQPQPAQPSDAIGLSPRELEVLRLVARGLGDAQIAAQLGITRRTVTGHLQSIYNKLGAPSRTAAAAWAWEHRLV